MALLAYFIIRPFHLIFLAGTVFFSHTKSARTVFSACFFSEANGAHMFGARMCVDHGPVRLFQLVFSAGTLFFLSQQISQNSVSACFFSETNGAQMQNQIT